ncbi:MAG TPA: hypothetical protein VFZ65_23760 [Planctomycetota bacterium]|nr:hypothetical protein [Planctomycetota bacterium]
MHNPVFFATLLSLNSLLVAQVPTIAVRAVSTLSTSAQNGAVASSQTRPIGPLPTIGNVDAIVTNGASLVEASTSWGATANATLAGFVVEQHLVVRGSTGGSCASGPNEIVFGVSSPVQRPAILTVRLSKAASPGTASTTVLVDIGNDGTIDATAASPVNMLSKAVSFGQQPLEVRVVLAGGVTPGQATDASLDDLVVVQVEPDNHLGVLPAAAGCANQAATLRAAWDLDSMLLDVDTSVATPLVVGVFGLSPAPVVLPNASLPLPCLLVPSPDLLVVVTPGGFTLHVPPAARPVSIWAQGVQVTAAGLATTNGFLVLAP